MKYSLLHLSDIHIKSDNNKIIDRVEKLSLTLIEALPGVDALFIVITGDIAYSGAKAEYEKAELFINKLIECISPYSPIPIHVVMVPGNHDGSFKLAGNDRLASIEKVREKGADYIDDGIIATCTSPQKEYFEFEKKYSTDHLIFSDPLWKEYKFTIGDKSISFSAINASWMSQVPEEPGKLVFPVKRYSSLAKSDSSIHIILLHHPLNWYSQGTYHPLRELCRGHYQIVMSGHEHTSTLSRTTDVNNQQSINLEAGALATYDDSSSFSIVTLDLEKQRFANEVFSWIDDSYLPENGVAVWDTFIPLPESKPNNLQLTDYIKSKLESVGATFTHPNIKNISLSDVFIYPDLIELRSTDDSSENVNAEVLVKEIKKLKKVFIYGDDQYGKSSLIHHLYQQYYDIGYLPILLDVKDLTNLDKDQFLRLIHSTIEKQYGTSSVNKYAQTPREKKVVLVDDFDRVSSRGEIIFRVLNFLKSHFDHIVLSTGERFDVTVMSSNDVSEATTDFNAFKMLGFGYKLRNNLIRRWYEIGTDLTREELQEKVFNAEQITSVILGKGLVPMTAFNVLVILQTIEVNQKTALANAGLAEYYEFLIRRSLSDAKVKSEEFGEYLSYLSHLAWHMQLTNEKNITEDSFFQFNSKFSDEVHPTQLVERIGILKSAKIICLKDDGYHFAYPYLSYFFVAKYIAEHLEENEQLRDKVKHMCHHLYLRDNANIVLFLTHHSQSKWIVKEIAWVLSQLLSEITPLNLETDTQKINGWVNQKVRVAVDVRNTHENQLQVRDQDDKVKYHETDQLTELSSLKDLDELAQLNLLFKTSEILGQILKSRYGSMTKDFKAELLSGLFDAPLRAVNFFLRIVNDAPDLLIEEIAKRMKKKLPHVQDREKFERTAKRFVFQVVGSVTDSFLARQGETIGSPKLKESIEQVVVENGSLTYKLISIAAQLSYPNHAPIESIKRLAEELDTNYFGYKVLQGLAARHMYMYSLPPKVRNALSSAVSIDASGQMGIEMRSQSSKKLINKNSKSIKPDGLFAKLRESFKNNPESTNKILERYKSKNTED